MGRAAPMQKESSHQEKKRQIYAKYETTFNKGDSASHQTGSQKSNLSGIHGDMHIQEG